MEEQENKHLDNLSKKIIQRVAVESPSFNFTDAVMYKVNALSESKVTVYKPLISKTSWFIIGFCVLGLVSYILLFGSKTESSNLLQYLDLSMLSKIDIDVLPSVSLSKTFTYAILFFGLMVCVQIPLLKNHFDKRFE
jgi:hypothetical protein